MFTIGTFSKLTRTTIKTIRYYDQVGLLKPQHTNPQTGYRSYTTKQLIQLQNILALRQSGLSIEEIQTYLKATEEGSRDIKDILKTKEQQIMNKIQTGEEQLSRIRHQIRRIEEEKEMKYQAIIKQTPECIVYSKKLTAPNYNSYFTLIPAIGEELKKTNPDVVCSIPEYCFISYLDNEYKETNMNIEFCEAVDTFGTDTETIKFKKIPSITVVSVMHKGPYETLAEAYTYAFTWMEDNNWQLDGPPRENHIDGIWNKQNKEDWLTELQIPVRKAP